ncbi:hypothetical protein RHGRI_025425 [Rhododendron griersonianum]|uniref:Uncharacterized protein n=1 Tax=Rhododendron griersonianum TaxID=479676 RepID=A0AAV6IP05_9ERIC|nr:hypothetical protein RHGRI_025425 [Rhododendron griersonianum]
MATLQRKKIIGKDLGAKQNHHRVSRKVSSKHHHATTDNHRRRNLTRVSSARYSPMMGVDSVKKGDEQALVLDAKEAS